MNNEGKKEKIWDKVKRFFKNIFRKNQKKVLPEPQVKTTDKLSKSKEEYLKLYKDVKDKKIDANILTDEDLKVLIAVAKEEIKFLDKKIDNERTEINMYKSKIEYYNSLT